MKFKNKTIVVIGGTSGIGFEVARQALLENANVILTGRSEKSVTSALAKLNNRAQGFVVDNMIKDSLKNFFAQIPSFDHLFTPGASYSMGPFTEISDEIAESPFKSKFWGQYYAVKYALPKLNKDGSVVLMSGAASARPLKNAAAYAACNAAIEGLARGLAVELAPLRVNAISPGTVDSDLWRNRPKEIREPAFDAWKKLNLTGTVACVEDTADVVLFLMSNKTMTGNTVFTDGGYTMK